MNRRVLTLLATLAIAWGLVFGAASTAAAVDGSIVHVDRTADGLQLTLDVPADATPDLSGVTVSVNGTTYPSTASPAAEGDTLITRTTVLAIDTSDSMQGERFTAAQAAASTFLDTVPDDVRVGIVTFAGAVTTELEPTTDRAAARAVVDGLTLSRGTKLYEGLIQALGVATADGGQAAVLVLSDGADTGKVTLLEDAVAAVDDADIAVDVVALEQTGSNLGVLAQLTGEHGNVIQADSDALSQAFSDEAEVLARQVAVSTQVPADVLPEQLTVKVTLPTSTGDVTAETIVLAGPALAPPAPENDPLGSIPAAAKSDVNTPDWFIYAGATVFGIGLLLMLLMLMPRKAPPMTVEERVTSYTGTSFGSATTEREPSEPAMAQATQAMAHVLQRNQGLDERISHRLEAAGSDLKASEWLLFHAAIFVGTTLLGLLLGRGNLIIGVIFMIAGAVLPWVYLGIMRSSRRKKFNAQLPETLGMMAGSLQAGLSLMQSADTIVREASEPMAGAFRRVLVETRLGVSLEDAMDGVADRFDSRDFRWVVMAIRIQRQVGGNLAELLNTVAHTMREREYIRRQVNALAAEGKLSAYVLSFLPVGFMGYLCLTQWDYVKVMFTEPLGILMLAGASAWLAIGAFWMSKLVKVEV